MKRLAYGISLLALAVSLALPPPAEAREVRVQVNMAPLGRVYSPPPLGRKQGWLTISNRDWQSYSLVVSGKDTLSLYRAGSGYGGVVIPSGATISIALDKDNYDLYGNSPDKLKVRIREGRTTTLSLEPFGYANSSGLMGVVNDGDRVRNGTLFDVYTAPVVVPAPPPTVIVRPTPPPPPVIVQPPSYHRPRPPAHRPPPPPAHRPGRPGHGGKGKNDGWNVFFGFGSR